MLGKIQAADPCVSVVLMTVYGGVSLAVEALKQGAADFVLKDFSTVERKDLPFEVDRCADATEALIGTGLTAAQNAFHAS